MRTKIAAALLILVWSVAPAAAERAPGNLADLARTALEGDPEAAAGLRQAGPAGMEALLALCRDGSCGDTQDAVDRVCGVRDCAEIRLFWYTDLEAAKAAARAQGKPILSLRLLGRLDEELSCANSRFFRTVFYKNREINALLRERFVLHWRSVRPVPRVTIDFGDGTRLERTLTGNSIHYVLDSRGRLMEALPGLYGPEAFRNALQEAARAAHDAASMDDEPFIVSVSTRHMGQLNDRAEAFRRDRMALTSTAPAAAPRRVEAPPPQPRPQVVKTATPPRPAARPKQSAATELEKIPTARDPWAILASTPGVLTDRINVGGSETGAKSSGERAILEALEGVSDEEIHKLAKLRRPRVHLDADSRAFLLRKHGVTDPEKAEQLVDAFETAVALDEVINEYRTGPEILRRLSDPKAWEGLELEAFNQWVYEEVFDAPLSDPWMGLAPEDVYVALPSSTRTAPARP